jgi:hypothetical protein
MYRIERTALPDGLRAVLHRGQDRHRVIYVSGVLAARDQRAAVMAALRASRHARRWTRLLVAAAMLLAGVRVRLGRAAPRSMARLAWAAAAVAVAVVAWAFVATTPLHDGVTATRLQVSGIGRAQQQRAPGNPGQPAPGQPAPGQHGPGWSPRAPTSALSAARPAVREPSSARSPGSAPSASPSPPSASPSPSPSSPPPSPSPSPSPKPRPGSCIVILGIRVCVRA